MGLLSSLTGDLLVSKADSDRRVASAFLRGMKDAHEQVVLYQQLLYRELAREPHTKPILATIDSVEAGLLAHYLDREKELQKWAT